MHSFIDIEGQITHSLHLHAKQKIINEQLALKRIADIAIDMFAITSCLARASRSKSIGLRNHDHEVRKACPLYALSNSLKRSRILFVFV